MMYIFCERKRHGKIIFKRKVWSECRNGEGEWGETQKNTTVRYAYITFVLPATGNSYWFNSDAACHQMSITPHQKDLDAVSVSQ